MASTETGIRAGLLNRMFRVRVPGCQPITIGVTRASTQSPKLRTRVQLPPPVPIRPQADRRGPELQTPSSPVQFRGGRPSVVEAEGDDAAPCDGVLSGCEFHRSPQDADILPRQDSMPITCRRRFDPIPSAPIHCPSAGWSGRQALNLERRRFETFGGSQFAPGELPARPLRFERRKIQVRHLGPEPSWRIGLLPSPRPLRPGRLGWRPAGHHRCRPGGVSNRTQASTSARKAWRSGAMARSIGRNDTMMPCSRQILAHHVAVAAVPMETVGEPGLQTVQPSLATRSAEADPAIRLEVALHGIPAAAELDRNPPRPPAQLVQPGHRRHVLRRQHRILPQANRLRRALLNRHRGHPSFDQRGGQFFMSPPGQFSMSPDRWVRQPVCKTGLFGGVDRNHTNPPGPISSLARAPGR
jgi:hypothetical protein